MAHETHTQHHTPTRASDDARRLTAGGTALAALFTLGACGVYPTEPCSTQLNALDIAVTHDGATPILTFDEGLTGYQLSVYDEPGRQEMWGVISLDDGSAADSESALGSPIRYGDNDALPTGAEAEEAFPLEDGREYTVWLYRGCNAGGGTSVNTAEGRFTYAAPDGADVE